MGIDKESFYKTYCAHCEHKSKAGEEEPCNECLTFPVNTYTHKPVKYNGSYTAPETSNGFPGYFEKVDDVGYLYYAKYDWINYKAAKSYYWAQTGSTEPINIGGCSSVRSDTVYGRNLDWLYNDQVEFVVKTKGTGNRYSSLAVCGGLSAFTKDKVEAWNVNHYLYKILPFQVQDGVNEHGVFVNMNVVPLHGLTGPSEPIFAEEECLCNIMLCRFILDKFKSAFDAVNYIASHVAVYNHPSLAKMGYELHYMVGDEYSTFSLGFEDNIAYIVNLEDHPYLTNFPLYGVTFNKDDSVYTPATQDDAHNAINTNHIHPYGAGLERWNQINDIWRDYMSIEDMTTLMRNLKYTRAYLGSDDVSEPYWYTEFVDGDVTCASNPYAFSDIIDKANRAYLTRKRTDGGKTWETTHTAIYDTYNKELTLYSKENYSTEYKFKL